MKVFTNDTDTVVAVDLADVPSAFNSTYGDGEFESNENSLDDWREVPGDRPITIHNVEGRGHMDKETRTASEWAEKDGRGLLCSTEW